MGNSELLVCGRLTLAKLSETGLRWCVEGSKGLALRRIEAFATNVVSAVLLLCRSDRVTRDVLLCHTRVYL